MTEYATKSFIKRNLSYKSNLNRTWSIVICTYHFKKSYNASTSGILTWGLHWMQRLLLTISLPATLPSDPRQQTQETSVISHTGTAHIDACQRIKRAGQIGAKRHWPKKRTFWKHVCENSLILGKSINVAVRWYLIAKQPTSRRTCWDEGGTTVHNSHHHQPSAFRDFQRVLTQWKTQSNHIFSHLCHVVRPLRVGFEHPTPAYILT